MQVADEAAAFLETAKEHSNVQLESTAFPGQPVGVPEYIRQVENVVTRASFAYNCIKVQGLYFL